MLAAADDRIGRLEHEVVLDVLAVAGVEASEHEVIAPAWLHARYGKDGAPNDLVFKAAPPIVGGREVRDEAGQLEERAKPDDTNNFQGRYAIRHR